MEATKMEATEEKGKKEKRKWKEKKENGNGKKRRGKGKTKNEIVEVGMVQRRVKKERGFRILNKSKKINDKSKKYLSKGIF